MLELITRSLYQPQRTKENIDRSLNLNHTIPTTIHAISVGETRKKKSPQPLIKSRVRATHNEGKKETGA